MPTEPIDLNSQLTQQLASDHQQAMGALGQIRLIAAQNFETAANLIRMSGARKMDELDAVESRATSGVMATPVAGPTTAQPAG